MDKNWIEGVAEQGDEALVIKAEWRKSGGCSQGVRSYPGRSPLWLKGRHCKVWNEKSVEAVVVASGTKGRVDKVLEKHGHCFARYADDCNVYVCSRRTGERVRQLTRRGRTQHGGGYRQAEPTCRDGRLISDWRKMRVAGGGIAMVTSNGY